MRVVVAHYNNTREKITLVKGTVVAKVTAANVIPPMLALTESTYYDIPQDKGDQSLKMPILRNIPKNQSEAQHWHNINQSQPKNVVINYLVN